MKPGFLRLVLILLLGILASGCYPYVNHPALSNWPKYVPAQAAQLSFAGMVVPAPDSCAVHAVDLLGAWVAGGSPETDPFPFTDVSGKGCQGAFEPDILPLFSEANLWYSGAPSCRTCHGPDVEISYARMDLSSYQGILSGSGRESAETKGDDILGGGDWQSSELHDVLTKGEMPPGLPPGFDPKGPLVHAGTSP